MKKKHKIIIIGAGRIFNKHFEYLHSKKNSFFEIVGIVEKKEHLLNKITAPNIKKFNDIKKAINILNFETAVILTESGSHAKFAEFFLKLKKNVIIEKPLSVNLKEADKLVQLDKKSKNKLFVVKQNRFNLPIEKLNSELKKKSLGKIFMATSRVRWMRDKKYYAQAKWRGTFKNDGGVICNQAIHHIDLLQWLVGDIKSVFAYRKKTLAKIQCEDTAVAIIKFKNGSLGTFEASTAVRPQNLEGSISILGTKGSVVIGGFSANKILSWNIGGRNKINVSKYEENPPNVYGFGHIKFYDFVSKCLKGKIKNTLSAAEAIKSLKIATAMQKSFETKKEINIKENLLNTRLGK